MITFMKNNKLCLEMKTKQYKMKIHVQSYTMLLNEN